jgi:hypothetical protein
MNQIIEGYCEPRRDRFTFFWTVVLDSSVMTLGGKVRVVSAIADQLDTKIESGKLSSVLSLRNAFAHHSTTAHPLVRVGETPEESTAHYQLYVMNAAGKIKQMTREDALQEFRSVFKKAKASLLELLDLVKEQRARNEPNSQLHTDASR